MSAWDNTLHVTLICNAAVIYCSAATTRQQSQLFVFLCVHLKVWLLCYIIFHLNQSFTCVSCCWERPDLVSKPHILPRCFSHSQPLFTLLCHHSDSWTRRQPVVRLKRCWGRVFPHWRQRIWNTSHSPWDPRLIKSSPCESCLGDPQCEGVGGPGRHLWAICGPWLLILRNTLTRSNETPLGNTEPSVGLFWDERSSKRRTEKVPKSGHTHSWLSFRKEKCHK